MQRKMREEQDQQHHIVPGCLILLILQASKEDVGYGTHTRLRETSEREKQKKLCFYPNTFGSVLLRLLVPLVLCPALFFEMSRLAFPADEPRRVSADGAALQITTH